MNETLTTVQLTEYEAAQFVRFQKHRALIELLEKIDAFDIKNGSVTINFDHMGGIGSLERREHYRL